VRRWPDSRWLAHKRRHHYHHQDYYFEQYRRRRDSIFKFPPVAVLTLNKTTISGNSSVCGGAGVDSSGGARVTLINSTVSGNAAERSSGGGVANLGDLQVTNTTVSRNTAEYDGGGLSNSGTVTLARTLISGNTAARGAEEVVNFIDASVNASNFNLFGHRGLTNAQAFTYFTPGPTDITATSNGNRPIRLDRILNTTLANNGGPTRTHALVAGSPAIDTVTDGTCPPPRRDQRGVRRPQDGDNDGAAICDTGSFERRPRE
jgi:hypothetical protein